MGYESYVTRRVQESQQKQNRGSACGGELLLYSCPAYTTEDSKQELEEQHQQLFLKVAEAFRASVPRSLDDGLA